MKDYTNELEYLRFIVTTHRNEFEKRRALQLRGLLSLITALCLSMALKLNEKSSLLIGQIPNWLIITSLLSITIIGSAFLYLGHSANAFNKNVAHKAEESLQMMFNGSPVVQLDLYSGAAKLVFFAKFTVGSGGYWGWLFETIVLVVFSAITYAVLCS